jgi:ABC-2 type transport system permease protein
MRYLRLYRSFGANCVARAMEFRAQFVIGIGVYLVWSAVSLLFIGAVFGQVEAVRGWSRSEMWVLYGSAVLLESACWGLLGINMQRFSQSVQDGTLDLALSRPVPVQFMVSTRYIDLNAILNMLPGAALIFVGLRGAGISPSPAQWLGWAGLMGCGFAIAYALWFASVTIGIWAVKLEAIAVLFDPMMQMARFPVDMYPRAWAAWLTWALPIAFLTTLPTQALLGRDGNASNGASKYLLAPLLAAALLVAANRFFHFALRSYSSASS